MATTDLIVLCLSIYLLLLGFTRGLMRSLMGPVSMIVATIASIFYYQQTKDMTISLLIGLAGPLFLVFIFKTVFRLSIPSMEPNIVSRLAGAAVTLAWGMVFVAFTLIFLNLLPPMGDALKALHTDLRRSNSYALVSPLRAVVFPSPKTSFPPASSSGEQVKSLAQDPRFEEVLKDPEIQAEINNHDFAKLISNPKMMDLTKKIMSDPAMLKKVMEFYNNNQAQLQTALSPNSK